MAISFENGVYITREEINFINLLAEAVMENPASKEWYVADQLDAIIFQTMMKDDCNLGLVVSFGYEEITVDSFINGLTSEHSELLGSSWDVKNGEFKSHKSYQVGFNPLKGLSAAYKAIDLAASYIISEMNNLGKVEVGPSKFMDIFTWNSLCEDNLQMRLERVEENICKFVGLNLDSNTEQNYKRIMSFLGEEDRLGVIDLKTNTVKVLKFEDGTYFLLNLEVDSKYSNLLV